MILDACRDNPFAGKTRNIRSAGGLAEMGARGTLIAYASAPGAPAEDGPRGKNSVYTRNLAEEMMVPGLEVEQMFKNVRVKVLRDTKDRQVPWVNTSLTSNFSFNPTKAGPTVAERTLQERVKVLESQLARERQQLAASNERMPAPAAVKPGPGPSREPAAGPAPPPAVASPPPVATQRIGRLQAELEATRRDLVSSSAPPPPAVQAAAKEALTNLAATSVPSERRLLRKSEFEQMFVGKNHTFIHLSSGATVKWYIRGDGNVFFKNQTDGKVGYGAWKLDDDGRFCVEWWRGGNTKNCMYYFSESGKTVRAGSPDPRSKAHAQILDIQ